MTTAILQKEHQNLIKRQRKIEKDFEVLKTLVFTEVDEANIQPVAFKKWDKISHDLDQKKGYFFISRKELRQWFKSI